MPNERAIEEKILQILEQRGSRKTACPSEIARALDPDDWRSLMVGVREAAGRLAAAGRIEITQKGRSTTVHARGPIRLRLR